MKICKDCVHADTTSKEPKYWKCRAPEVVRIITDLVTGETITLDVAIATARVHRFAFNLSLVK